jgi:hypothetical protein
VSSASAASFSKRGRERAFACALGFGLAFQASPFTQGRLVRRASHACMPSIDRASRAQGACGTEREREGGGWDRQQTTDRQIVFETRDGAFNDPRHVRCRTLEEPARRRADPRGAATAGVARTSIVLELGVRSLLLFPLCRSVRMRQQVRCCVVCGDGECRRRAVVFLVGGGAICPRVCRRRKRIASGSERAATKLPTFLGCRDF